MAAEFRNADRREHAKSMIVLDPDQGSKEQQRSQAFIQKSKLSTEYNAQVERSSRKCYSAVTPNTVA